MEDFGSILWIVALIGFAIYSVAAKGRKKEDQTAHGEAWTPWNEDSDTEETQKAQQTQNTEDELSASRHMSEQNQSYGMPKAPYSYEDTEAFSEEAQSLEDIPEQEYTSLEESGSTLSGTLNPHTATQVFGRNAFVNSQHNVSGRNSHTHNTPEGKLHTTDSTEAEVHDNAVQNDFMADFNLRKAVIYSEILKPKFDE